MQEPGPKQLRGGTEWSTAIRVLTEGLFREIGGGNLDGIACDCARSRSSLVKQSLAEGCDRNPHVW